MTRKMSFDDALDVAVDALLDGESLEDVLARFPQHAVELRPILQAAATISPRVYEPPSMRLADGEARIRDAAAAAGRELAASGAGRARPWWSRRVVLASTSVPLLGLVLAVMGGGAATAAIAVHEGLPETIGNQVERVTPGWSHDFIPGGDSGQSRVSAPGEGPGQAASHTPGLTDVTVEGKVTDIRGNVFDLEAPGTEYHVQTDAKTDVEGELAEGADVAVEGVVSGDGMLHASSVTIVSAPDPSDTPAGVDESPEPTTASDAATSAPGTTRTPPGQADKTPPGQPELTRTPGRPETTKTPGPPPTTRTPGPPSGPPGQQSN